MKLTKLHLIIILALALIICPVLGVCHDTREYFDVVENMGEEEEEEEEENKDKPPQNDYNGPNYAN
jgi:hypothetical protein